MNDPRLLFANDWFYTAFGDADQQSMTKLWSKKAEVTCQHPGWEPLIGYKAVLDSWSRILTGPDTPPVEHFGAQAFVMAEGKAGYVLCFEKIGEHYLSATNIFVMEQGDWRMVHHQATPTHKPEGLHPQQPETWQ